MAVSKQALGAASRRRDERAVSDKVPIGYHVSYAIAARLCVLILHVVVAVALWQRQIVPFIWGFYTFLVAATACLDLCIPELEPIAPSQRDLCKSVEWGNAFRHIVLVSHYKEDFTLVSRTLSAIDAGAALAEWPVIIVHAVEEDSRMQAERWDMTAIPMSNIDKYAIAVHEHGLAGERAGLGSNLRNAVRHICEEMDVAIEGTLVTKIDGNAVLGRAFFKVLEADWAACGHSQNVAFQPMIHEAGHEEWEQLGLLNRFAAYFGSMIHPVPTILFPGSGFHSSFCMPLRMILNAGSWDPWLIQEDNLMCQRAVLGNHGDVSVQLLRSSIYNAPTLTVHDYVQQYHRCVVHGLYALGFSLANVHLLRNNIPQMLRFFFRVVGHVSMLFMVPLSGLLGTFFWPAQWSDYQWVQRSGSVLMQVLLTASWSKHAFAAGGLVRVAECIAFGPIGGLLSVLLGYYYTLYFCFLSHETQETYTTTLTLSEEDSNSSESETE